VSEQSNAEGRKLQWLVYDQLGTPRMVFDTSGKLHDDPATTNVVEGVRRHDYLPFGEENVYNPAGGSRTAANGYLLNDGVRQQFTGHERDSETGLDFMQARYYANVQGRFISPDPVGHAWADENDPQSWNLYSYTRNNPLAYTDPEGLRYKLCDPNGKCSDHSDANVDEWRQKESINFSKGKIFDKDGNQIGTYQRLGDDNWSDFQNALFFGNAKDPGLAGRAQATKNAIYIIAAVNLSVPAAIFTIEIASGAAFAGVENHLITVRAARPFSHLTLHQLKALIKGKNKLLAEWFQSGGTKIPNGLNSKDLKVYAEIALRDIARGQGGREVVLEGGRVVQVQYQRLIQILKALGDLK
jgi:RHS repeat-associated protein